MTVNDRASPQRSLTIDQLSHRIEIDELITRYTIAVDAERFDMLDTVYAGRYIRLHFGRQVSGSLPGSTMSAKPPAHQPRIPRYPTGNALA